MCLGCVGIDGDVGVVGVVGVVFGVCVVGRVMLWLDGL